MIQLADGLALTYEQMAEALAKMPEKEKVKLLLINDLQNQNGNSTQPKLIEQQKTEPLVDNIFLSNDELVESSLPESIPALIWEDGLSIEENLAIFRKNRPPFNRYLFSQQIQELNIQEPIEELLNQL
jgi:hypothetical protein